MKLNFFFQALLVFSRDTSILEHFEHSSATPPKSYIRGNLFVERRFLGEKIDRLNFVGVCPGFLEHETTKSVPSSL